MSLLSEMCYCCGEQGPPAWPLNAQMTPREKKNREEREGEHCLKLPTSNLSPGLIIWLRQVMCCHLPQINKPFEDANQGEERD